MSVSEIRIGEIPIPIINYLHLIKNRQSPYYDIIQFLLKEMEMRYLKEGQSEVIYAINPRALQEEIKKKIKSDKVTTVNVCRTILAFLYGSKLREEEDFYTTTTSGGRTNYHIKINQRTLNAFSWVL